MARIVNTFCDLSTSACKNNKQKRKNALLPFGLHGFLKVFLSFCSGKFYNTIIRFGNKTEKGDRNL